MLSRRLLLLHGLGPLALACSLGASAAPDTATATATATGAPASPTSPAARAASAPPRAAAAADGHRVIEDDQVRIDELRVRGEVRSITVQSKLRSAPPYGVLVRRSGRDPSQDDSAAGHSVWSLLDF